jgi:hypothetical protein
MAARALAMIGPSGLQELVRQITPQAAPETARRVLGVLELAAVEVPLGTVLAGAGHPDASVREAAVAVVERVDPAVAAVALRRLLGNADAAVVRRALQAAARTRASSVASEVVRLASATEDEDIARACCQYFSAVPMASAAPALKRIVERRSRMFGLGGRGWSEETRAAAAARELPGTSGQVVLEAAQSDPSPRVREAATRG